MSTTSADVGGVRLASSDKLRGAVPKVGTSAWVTSDAGEEKRVCFAPSPRVIPDAWFQLLSEGVRFPSSEEEEQLRSKLQGFTVVDVEPGRGRPEASTQKEGMTETKDANET